MAISLTVIATYATNSQKIRETAPYFFPGLSETAVHLQGAAKGQGLPQRSFPNVSQLTKRALNSHNAELGLLSPPGSVSDFVLFSRNFRLNVFFSLYRLQQNVLEQ